MGGSRQRPPGAKALAQPETVLAPVFPVSVSAKVFAHLLVNSAVMP